MLRLAGMLGLDRTRARPGTDEEWFQPPKEVSVRTDSIDAHRDPGGARRMMVGALNVAVAFGALAPQVTAAFDYGTAPSYEVLHMSDVWVNRK